MHRTAFEMEPEAVAARLRVEGDLGERIARSDGQVIDTLVARALKKTWKSFSAMLDEHM
jgi:hypothetical protein